jgi:hypothetical protein
MTDQAGRVVALEGRCADDALVQPVEDDALHGILGGDLDEAAADPADRHAIVEEKRAWIGHLDPTTLNAVRVEDHDLGFERNVQRVEHGSQITGRAVALERNRAAFDVCGKLRDWIASRRLRVRDCRVIEPVRERPRQRAFFRGA